MKLTRLLFAGAVIGLPYCSYAFAPPVAFTATVRPAFSTAATTTFRSNAILHLAQNDDSTAPEKIYHLNDSTKWSPFYAMTFDKTGACTSTDKLNRLLNEMDTYTDVYIVSHGWDTTPEDAVEQYKNWTRGYISLRRYDANDIRSSDYSPVVVGIIWPSKWTFEKKEEEKKDDNGWFQWPNLKNIWPFGSDDKSRDIESVSTSSPGVSNDDYARAVKELTDDCVEDGDEDSKTRLSKLLNRSFLDKTEALEILDSLKPLSVASGILEEDVQEHIRNILQAGNEWASIFAGKTGEKALPPATFQGIFGDADEASRDATTSGVDVTDVINLLSFWEMRKRARVVGWEGVNKLIRSVLSHNKQPRVHVVGHSFGASVLLSAVAEKEPASSWPGQVSSMLLLQPAVEHKVFAANDELGVFRRVFGRVKPPIVSTFTNKDDPLRVAYQVAMGVGANPLEIAKHFELRSKNELEKESDVPPNKYAALGGYPPDYLSSDELRVIDSLEVGQHRDFGTSALCAVKMHKKIDGHTDIFKDDVYWLLHNLIERPPVLAN